MGMNEINLMHGDCLELMKEIPVHSVDMVLCDPPYLFVHGGQKSKKWNHGIWNPNSYTMREMQDFGEKEIFNFLDLVISKQKKVNMFIFCSRLQVQYYLLYCYQHKKLKYDILVWNKGRMYTRLSKVFTNDIEYIIRIYENGVSLNKICRENGVVDSKYYLKLKNFKKPKGEHETMKPVEMLEEFIKLASNENGMVLDCFMGSGSTGVACVNTGRAFIGIEKDDHYFEVATKRIEDAKKDIEARLFA